LACSGDSCEIVDLI